MTITPKHEIQHGLYLTVGYTSDDRLVAIISDGHTTENHHPITVLDVETVASVGHAKEWFEEWKQANCRH